MFNLWYLVAPLIKEIHSHVFSPVLLPEEHNMQSAFPGIKIICSITHYGSYCNSP